MPRNTELRITSQIRPCKLCTCGIRLDYRGRTVHCTHPRSRALNILRAIIQLVLADIRDRNRKDISA